jgi:lipopolysaccharide/colanic/teichoic acid biosynthesis glycosyltransferase
MWYFLQKRVLDITLSLFGLVLLLPLFLIIAVTIKLNSPGPVFADTPERVGQDGKVFKMYKFRSMIKDAHLLLREDRRFKDFYRKYRQSNFKIPTDEDPRITAVGKFIRKTSLDELPQLINILKGDMSLVGPRAFHVDEIRQQQKRFPSTKDSVREALKVKPGLTGPWQVSGRSKLDFPERIRLDAQYAKNRSILYDFSILFRTIPAVLRGEGN